VRGDASRARFVSVTARRAGGCDRTALGVVIEGGVSKCETVFVGSILVALALLAISPGIHAQTSAKPGPAAAKAIPDLSGNWEAHRQVPITAETALCGIRFVCTDYSE